MNAHTRKPRLLDLSGVPEYPFTKEDRLQTHFYFEMHFSRWLNSDFRLLATPAVRGIAIDLFCAAQEQAPVGTLPTDERLLAKLAGVTLEVWRELAAQDVGPLWNWYHVSCGDDVRFAHPVVLELVEKAMVSREMHNGARAADRERKRLKALPAQMQSAGASSRMCAEAAVVDWVDRWLVAAYPNASRTVGRVKEALEAHSSRGENGA